MGILEFKDVNKGFGEGTHRAEVLKNITLSVKEGEFLAILGFSGTGKSTLMNLIAGLEMPDSGALTFRGAPIAGPGPDRGLVFQSYSLMPWLTVRGNIMLAVDAVHGKLTRAEKTATVDHYIAMVGLTHAAHRRPAELSGGMRQRVAVARALAMEPDLLLLDEPLSALDALTRANLADEILDIWEEDKKTCVLITNDVDEAILLADRIIVLNPDGTLADPVPVVSEARVGMIEERFLDFSQLHKVYPTPKGPLTVVEDFDLKVNQGEFISLIGHSGCGKSTVLTMAAGLNAISKGAIKLDGRHVEGADPERAQPVPLADRQRERRDWRGQGLPPRKPDRKAGGGRILP